MCNPIRTLSSCTVRCVARWLKDDEEGVYDDAFQWSYEKRKSTFKMPGGGAKVADPELEKHLLKAVAECEEGNLQVLSELLIMEAVTFRPNWCGGAADPTKAH